MRKPSAHAIFSAVFRKHDRCCLQGFPGAAARLAVTYRPVILRIYFSGVDDSSAVMTQNAGEQTLFVVFGASVSDSLDIYTGFVCMTFAWFTFVIDHLSLYPIAARFRPCFLSWLYFY